MGVFDGDDDCLLMPDRSVPDGEVDGGWRLGSKPNGRPSAEMVNSLAILETDWDLFLFCLSFKFFGWNSLSSKDGGRGEWPGSLA